MSFRLVAEALELDLPPGPKLTLVVLAFYANDAGLCSFSVAQLAGLTGQGGRSVSRCVATLRDTGALEVVTLGSGRGRRSEYRVTPGNHANLAGFRAGNHVNSAAFGGINPDCVAAFTPETMPNTPETMPNTTLNPAKLASLSIREPKTVPVRERPRNPTFDAIVEAWGVNPADLTERQQKRVGIAAAQLQKVSATPGEILSRGRIYRALGWNRDCQPPSPDALVSHWAECIPAALERVDRKALDRELAQRTMDASLRKALEAR